MSQLMITVIVVGMMLPTDGSQHSDCVDCPDGTGSMPLSPLSYNITRSHIFNGTQPSNEGCTNGDEQATVKCGQGTTLIDCDRGYNDSIDSSNLSSYFTWNRRAQQVFIVFRFDQQINISRITMFFWNSPSNSIIVPNVRIAWADHNVQFRETTITTNSPNRTEDGRSILNIGITNDRLKFLYLRIEMTFYSNSEWIFLSEVQFCGNTAPFNIILPSTDNDVQIVSPTATMTNVTCSLNITIPSTVTIVWLHNNNNVLSPEEIETTNTTTLLIENFQTSDAGVYQCVFNDVLGSGWTLRRNTEVKVPQIIQPSTDDHRVDAYKSGSIPLTCSLNINIPSSVTVTWISNNTVIATPPNKLIEIGSTNTTLLIKKLQPSDAGVYQCVFTDAADGWTLRKNITLLITVATATSTATVTSTVSMPISITEATITGISSAFFTTVLPSSVTTEAGISATFVTITTSSSYSTDASISATFVTIAPSSSATTDASISATFVTIAPSSSAATDASVSTTFVTITPYITPTITPSFVTISSSSSTAVITSTIGITTSTFTVTHSTDISTTNATLTSTNTLSTIATTSATVRGPATSISIKYSTAVTIIGTTISTTTPAVVTNSEETSSSGDINIGIIAIPVIVIMVVTLVIIVVIITFFCRRKRRFVIHKPTSSIEEPWYNTIPALADPAAYRNSNLYETLDQWKRMSLEQPHRRSLSNESNSETSLESPQLSPEESTKYLEFNIYATPDDLKSNIPSMVFDHEKQMENPTYDVLHHPLHNEGIEPGDIDSSSHACTSEHDGAYPYSSIYADALPLLRSQGPPVVSVENIKELDQLGTGHFGKVMLAETKGLSKKYLGIGNSNDGSICMKVAVKMLKAHRSDEVQKSFEKEIKFMSRLKDDNVIRLLGICTTGTPFIMMEYMENGDLNKYLKERELTLTTETEKEPNEITLHTLIYMSIQIASGMKYLSTCKFIHRDLAARNILVGTDYVVKIADFGMSRSLYSADYCRVSKLNVLPVRWMAFECFYGKFSIQTDVWSFGITLWEVFTLCKCQPFSEFTDQEMIDDAVLGSNRKIPEQPDDCPSDVYNIIKSCLRHEPSERPAFSVLHDQLKECDSYVP